MEARCKLECGCGWDFPLIIERLEELADRLRDAVETGDTTTSLPAGEFCMSLHEDDHALLAGLAQVLAAALESEPSRS